MCFPRRLCSEGWHQTLFQSMETKWMLVAKNCFSESLSLKRIKRGINLSSTSHALFHACVWCLESQQPFWDLEGEPWRQSQKAENRLKSTWVHPDVVWTFESALSSPNYLQTFVMWDNRKSCFESSFSSKGGQWTNHISKIQNVLKQQNLGQYPRNAESESAC